MTDPVGRRIWGCDGGGMFRIIRKYWKYLASKLDSLHAEHADPKVLLQQAITEATDQHRRLTEQAASVVAHHRRVHQRRERLIAEHARAQASLVHALRLIDQHRTSGDDAEADRLTAASEAVATRLLATEQEVARSEQDLIDATRAADAAKEAVARNGHQLLQRVNERDRLLSDLDRAKMQEEVNATIRRACRRSSVTTCRRSTRCDASSRHEPPAPREWRSSSHSTHTGRTTAICSHSTAASSRPRRANGSRCFAINSAFPLPPCIRTIVSCGEEATLGVRPPDSAVPRPAST